MTTRQKQTTKRIATRRVDGRYRVTGQDRVYSTYAGAFQAAWRACRKLGADLYAIMPNGKWILLLDAKTIAEYERDHRTETVSTK